MPKSPPPLNPLDEMRTRAAFHLVGAFGHPAYVSLPLPQPGPEGPAVVFFFGTGSFVYDDEGRPSRLRLGAPTHVARFDADGGAFDELRVASPAELGLPADPPEFLGEVPYRSPDPYLPLEPAAARFLALCDLLAPSYASGARVSWETAERAAEMLALFDEALEAPLLPCYRAVGAHFLAWASRASAGAWWKQ